jgi:hypothetical protein
MKKVFRGRIFADNTATLQHFKINLALQQQECCAETLLMTLQYDYFNEF